jgi:hypothetical protein
MGEIGNSLDDKTIDWLLSPDNPTVRYRTMTELLGMSEGDGEVRAARDAIMSTGPVPKILERQRPGGFWGDPDRFYHDKYKGTVWNIMVLAELRADPVDSRIKDACEYILRMSQHRESGGFSYRGSESKGGMPSGVIPCLTANMVHSLVRLGYGGDERVRKAISWIVRYQRFETCPPPFMDGPYHYKRCWQPRDCRSGAVKAMKALSSLPMVEWVGDIEGSLQRGGEFLLEQCLYGGGIGLKCIARKDWYQLGYPHMWDTDLLEIVKVLIDSGIRDERIDEAVRFIRSKANEKGRWLQEGRFSDRLLVRLERKGEESRSVTLEALSALERIGGKGEPDSYSL